MSVASRPSQNLLAALAVGLLAASARAQSPEPAPPAADESAPASTDESAPSVQDPPPTDEAAPAAPPAEGPASAPAAAEPASPPAGESASPAAAAPAPAAKPASVTFTAAPGKGVTFTLDDSFAMNLKARGQLRYTFVHTNETDTSEINVRTARLSIQGHVVSKDLKYNLQLAFGPGDFEKDNASPIFDFWVEYVGLRDLNVRIGQFYVPFDRARTIRDYTLTMADRSLTVRELTLDRDDGIMISSSDLFGLGILGYHVYAGGGDGRNRLGPQAMGPLVIGRLVLRPFGAFDDDQEADLDRAWKPRLAVGVAGGVNVDAVRNASTIGTTYQVARIDYVHGAVDTVFKFAGLSLLAEAVLRRGTVDSVTGEVDGEPVTEFSRSGYGYLIQAGMMLTDYLEVVARWDQMFAWRGADTDPALKELVASQGRQLGTGINLYLNGHALKAELDYFFTFGKDASQGRHSVMAVVDATF